MSTAHMKLQRKLGISEICQPSRKMRKALIFYGHGWIDFSLNWFIITFVEYLKQKGHNADEIF